MGTVGSIVIHLNIVGRERKMRANSFDIFEPRIAEANDAPPSRCHAQSPLLRKQ